MEKSLEQLCKKIEIKLDKKSKQEILEDMDYAAGYIALVIKKKKIPIEVVQSAGRKYIEEYHLYQNTGKIVEDTSGLTDEVNEIIDWLWKYEFNPGIVFAILNHAIDEINPEKEERLLRHENLQKIVSMMATEELETCEDNSQVPLEVIDDIMAILRSKVICPLEAIAILQDIASNIVPYVCCFNDNESE